ncbi:MAG TPA: hypothetical protein VLV78_08330 [Thermoanaerobaculia bacterium]|nr:hypothetical protein [Thermoanaerobaculia bacterium]
MRKLLTLSAVSLFRALSTVQLWAQSPIAVHATSATSIQTAIDGGADSIEHGNAVTDAQLELMRDKGSSST